MFYIAINEIKYYVLLLNEGRVVKKFLLFLLIVSFRISSAQTGWFWVNPLPQGNTLYSVHFINSNTGWAAGDKGTVIKTTNGGSNWVIQNTQRLINFSIIYFTDSLNGLAASSDSSILIRTTNGGTNWTAFQISGNAKYKKMRFASPNTGFITGHDIPLGAVAYRTTNKGLNWFVCFQNTAGDNVTSLSFINNNTGWIIRDYQLLKTTDSGLNWNSVSYYSYADDFYFSDTSNAVLYSSYMIKKTTNGGLNFNTVYPGYPSQRIYAMTFPTKSTGFTAGDSGIILKTTNSGENWFSRETGTIRKLYGLSFPDSLTGFAVGQYGVIIKTTNGGLNWQNKSSDFNGNFSWVRFINQDIGWACGTSASILTTNGGNQWNVIPQDASQGFFSKVWFINSTTGWATCYPYMTQKLCKTTNNGINWELKYVFSPPNLHFYTFDDIFFINDNTGWIVGNDRYIYPPHGNSDAGLLAKTTDGGNNWEVTNPSGGFGELYQMQFINDNTGFIIGNNNNLLKTTNCGNNWLLIGGAFSGNSGVSYGRFWFVDSQTGWVACHKAGMSYIVKTTNSGANWIIQDSSAAYTPESIHFSDTNSGWISGYSGFIKATSNGGTNWMIQKNLAYYNINSIFFINNTTGYCVGDAGIILKTTSGVISGINSQPVSVPENYMLFQNYPNPFNATTKINFEIPKSSKVRVVVYDILGRKVEELVNSGFQAGKYSINWNAYKYSSGIYFYAIETEGYVQTRKCVLIK